MHIAVTKIAYEIKAMKFWSIYCIDLSPRLTNKQQDYKRTFFWGNYYKIYMIR
jgi:hypothetical protein